LVEIAAEAGYKGSVNQADDILRREGSLIIEAGPSGQMTVRRPDSSAPRVEVDFPTG
jgi:hypothetical protein